MSTALVWTSTALGAGDPIASGTVKLNRSSSFKKQLKRNHVKLKPKKFSIKSGSSLDPTTGAGTLKLGKITFKKGSKKLVYRKVTATLGANGARGSVKGSKGKLFSLKGGTVTRGGFGAYVSGVKVKLLKRAAKKINRKLGLHSLHPGKAGRAWASEQPKTVEVTGGTTSVQLAQGPGTVFGPANGSKMVAHCINPTPGSGGFELVAPASHPDPANPLLSSFPVVGGTIGPLGTDGVINEAGGFRFQKNISGALDCPSGTQSIQQTDQGVNLALNNIQSHVVIANSSYLNGDNGTVIVSDVDVSGRTFAADGTNHTIYMSGDQIKLNALSASTLNQVFPNVTGNPANDFAAGDLFGTSRRTVTTR